MVFGRLPSKRMRNIERVLHTEPSGSQPFECATHSTKVYGREEISDQISSIITDTAGLLCLHAGSLIRGCSNLGGCWQLK
jgi:hypothetical protein